MAFIKIEDKFGEIEVIVFARQYAKLSSEIFVENAVIVSGTVSVEEGEDAKILLSAVEPLHSNVDFNNNLRSETEKAKRVFIKLSVMNDSFVSKVTRLALLNP